MNKLLIISLIYCNLLLTVNSFSLNQNDSLKSDVKFISPVEIPISLAGNFGELRPGHFHAGLDIRTQGKEGLKIRSIYEGYVSRISISLNGYGKVVYVTHPNGYTSVYAHLSRFNDELEKFVKDYQYANKCFTLDLYPDKNRFNLNQGERVGWSGNTGGSGGPHLHFEVRNTLTEKPINPLHFNFDVKDNISPTLKNISIYPLNENSSVDNQCEQKTYKLIKSGNRYSIAGNLTPVIKGKIGFGIETIDKVNNSPFRCGVYSIELLKDGKRVYFHTMDSIGYHETRYINAHMDFHQAKTTKRKVQRSYLLEGNKLDIYKDLVNKGQLFFTDSTTHTMEYRVHDFEGNTSILEFKISSNQKEHPLLIKNEPVQDMHYGENNYYENENLKIEIPSTCLYENTPLYLDKKAAVGRCVTPRYGINRLSDPLQDYISLSINVGSIDKKLYPKLVIVSLTNKSEILAYEGGTIDSNWIKTKTRSFGPYTVMVDSISPKIKNLTNINGMTFQTNSTIKFAVSDNISGIKEFYALIDGEWHLIEYQKNKNTAFLKLDRLLKTKSSHSLEVLFTDFAGNQTIKSFKFIY